VVTKESFIKEVLGSRRMLDKLVSDTIVHYNLKKIAPSGTFRSSYVEEKPTLKYLEAGERVIIGYQLHFLFNNFGLIRYAGNHEHFPAKKLAKYNAGIFLVEVDLEMARKLAMLGRGRESKCEDKIVDVNFMTLPSYQAKKRILSTVETGNTLFGINYDLQFVEEDSIEEDSMII